MLHSFETRIVTAGRGSRYVIVYIEGFDDDGLPDWYFCRPNGLPDHAALKLCTEADYARITQEAIDVAQSAARRGRSPVKPRSRTCGQYAPTC